MNLVTTSGLLYKWKILHYFICWQRICWTLWKFCFMWIGAVIEEKLTINQVTKSCPPPKLKTIGCLNVVRSCEHNLLWYLRPVLKEPGDTVQFDTTQYDLLEMYTTRWGVLQEKTVGCITSITKKPGNVHRLCLLYHFLGFLCWL